MVSTHIEKIKHSMLSVTGMYLGNITNMIFVILHLNMSHLSVSCSCSSCHFHSIRCKEPFGSLCMEQFKDYLTWFCGFLSAHVGVSNIFHGMTVLASLLCCFVQLLLWDFSLFKCFSFYFTFETFFLLLYWKFEAPCLGTATAASRTVLPGFFRLPFQSYEWQ